VCPLSVIFIYALVYIDHPFQIFRFTWFEVTFCLLFFYTDWDDLPSQVASVISSENLDVTTEFSATDRKEKSLPSLYALFAARRALEDADYKPTEEQCLRTGKMSVCSTRAFSHSI